MNRNRHLGALLVFACIAALATGSFSPERITPSEVASWFRGPKLASCRALIEDNKVDGATLLELTDEELASQFNPTAAAPSSVDDRNNTAIVEADECRSAVRRAKSRLTSLCACRSPIVDFWSALRGENMRTWFGGSLLLFTPRIGWLYAYFFDATLLEFILSAGLIHSATIGWIMIIFCPDIFFALNLLPMLPVNYVLVVCAVQHYAVQTYEEITIAVSWWKGVTIFEPGTTFLQKLSVILPWWLYIPLGTLVTGWLGIALLFQQLLVGLFVLQSAYVTMSLFYG